MRIARACNTVHLGCVAPVAQLGSRRSSRSNTSSVWGPYGGHVTVSHDYHQAPRFFASAAQARADSSLICYYGHAGTLSFCRPVIPSSCWLVIPRQNSVKLLTTRQMSVECPCTPCQFFYLPRKALPVHKMWKIWWGLNTQQICGFCCTDRSRKTEIQNDRRNANRNPEILNVKEILVNIKFKLSQNLNLSFYRKIQRNSNPIKISIRISTASYWGVWVSQFWLLHYYLPTIQDFDCISFKLTISSLILTGTGCMFLWSVDLIILLLLSQWGSDWMRTSYSFEKLKKCGWDPKKTNCLFFYPFSRESICSYYWLSRWIGTSRMFPNVQKCGRDPSTNFLSFFLGFRRPNLITGLSGWRTPD